MSLEKIAKAVEDRKSNATKGAIAAIGAGSLYRPALNAATGRVRVMHGTTRDGAKKIKESGLDRNFGGSGGVAEKFGLDNAPVKNSKNHVYVTRSGSVARQNAGMASGSIKVGPLGPDMNDSLKATVGLHKGKVIKADMPYTQYKKMVADPEYAKQFPGGPGFNNGTAFERYLHKFHAAKGSENISPEHIRGGKKSLISKYKNIAKSMPGYIRSHPGRFAAGAAGLAGTAALGGYAYKKIKSAIKGDS